MLYFGGVADLYFLDIKGWSVLSAATHTRYLSVTAMSLHLTSSISSSILHSLAVKQANNYGVVAAFGKHLLN